MREIGLIGRTINGVFGKINQKLSGKIKYMKY